MVQGQEALTIYTKKKLELCSARHHMTSLGLEIQEAGGLP
jgi:hypothetical protein